MKTVIVTGSSGYIGGQTALQLKEEGYRVIGIDRKAPSPSIKAALDHSIVDEFDSVDSLNTIVASDAVALIHCAGTSLVGPSVTDPMLYYHNNYVCTKKLVDTLVMQNRKDIRIIFSSSASVYGEPIMTPCQEEDPPSPLSPYGESKYMVELMLQSYYRAYGIQPVIFRYFNACGADSKGRHGQEQNGTHIIARVLESIKDNKEFTLYGTNYPTTDGTCIRDYVHVEDIARAHILAINSDIPTGVYNLGSNEGTSNREIIAMAETITGKKVTVVEGDIRPGDPSVLTASTRRFDTTAGSWKQYSLADMIEHAWAWYVR
jgi:UDP-glucose 4-epimerase